MMSDHEVIIVGGGVAGLSAARVLNRCGVQNAVIVEREQYAGGLPRHSKHPGFGFSQFKWPYTGPKYVERLLRECKGINIQTSTTVTDLLPNGEIVVADDEGTKSLHAQAVLLATGIRETPAPPRMISGARPWGIFTTSAIQQFLHLAKHKPCQRPVIVGSEWVSFSVVLTLTKAGIRPAAVLEENHEAIASVWADRFVSTIQNIPVLKNTRLVRILGKEVVTGVEIEQNGTRRSLDCDAIVFTGKFAPEATLVQNSHLEWDLRTCGPVIDQHWQCSDPAYYAAGNLLRSVESSGIAAREGQAAAECIVRSLSKPKLHEEKIRIEVEPPLQYIYPQVLSKPGDALDSLQLRTRVNRAMSGVIRMIQNGSEIWSKKISVKPEQRICLPSKLVNIDQLKNLTIKFTEK